MSSVETEEVSCCNRRHLLLLQHEKMSLVATENMSSVATEKNDIVGKQTWSVFAKKNVKHVVFAALDAPDHAKYDVLVPLRRSVPKVPPGRP